MLTNLEIKTSKSLQSKWHKSWTSQIWSLLGDIHHISSSNSDSMPPLKIMGFWKNQGNATKQPILNSRQQRWNTIITTDEKLNSFWRNYNQNSCEWRLIKWITFTYQKINKMAYLTVICSRASTSVEERPAENITSKRPRTWGSITGPIAFEMLPTQAKASSEGLPLRGAIYRKKFCNC